MKRSTILGVVTLLSLFFWLWIRPGYWHLGFAVINLIFLAACLFIYRSQKYSLFTLFLGVTSGLLSIFMAIRSFEFVRFLSWWSIFLLDFLFVIYLRFPRSLISYSRFLKSILHLLPTLPISFRYLISHLKFSNSFFSRPRWAILKGVLYSIPLLIVFGYLFYSADPIFAKLVNSIKLPEINLDTTLIWDLFCLTIFSSTILSLFRSKLVKFVSSRRWLNQITETNVAVILLEVLFAVFAIIQLRYFNASPDIFRSLGIIYSVYTREGYQQLIFAAILALGVVLWLDYSIRSQLRRHINQLILTRSLAVILLVEIFILVISATKRNYFYQLAYGYTEIRLLGFALSSWMICMLFLVGYKIIKNLTANFLTRGTIIITALGVLGLNIANIDSIIVRQNPARTDQGVDYGYITDLSNDAYPAWVQIVNYIESTPNPDQSQIRLFQSWLSRLQIRYHKLGDQSKHFWNYGGSWNLSSVQSLSSLMSQQDRIKQLQTKLELRRIQLQETSHNQAQSELYRIINNVSQNIRSHYNQTPVLLSSQNNNTDYYFESVQYFRLVNKLAPHQEAEFRNVVQKFSNNKCTANLITATEYTLTCTIRW